MCIRDRPEGEYELGGQPVWMKEGKATLADGTLAGSSIHLMDEMRIRDRQSTGSGSGVIIGKNDTELLIATNNHVVSGAESLTVCFNDNKDAVFDAKIKGTDPNNDLAVIAIQLSDISEDVLNSISIATLGDSTQMEVGDQVVAIGNALGFGPVSYTHLDVYKRQPLHQLSQFREVISGDGSIPNSEQRAFPLYLHFPMWLHWYC